MRIQMRNVSVNWAGCIAGLALLAMAPPVDAKMLPAKSASEAEAAAKLAREGDEIVLADGQYKDLKLRLSGMGTAEKPIVLRAKKDGGASLTGSPSIELTGRYIVVQGLVFKDCTLASGSQGAVVFAGCSHSRLTGCRFENSQLPHGGAVVSFRNAAKDNRADHNCFLKTRYKAIVVVVDDAALKKGPPLGNRIDHNLFQDTPRYGKNGAETIQIGQRAIPYSDQRPETVVEDNQFVRCNGEAEIISVKTSGNTIRNNVFRDNLGEVVMRHGHNNSVTGNRFEGGSGGIRVSGHGHTVTGNTLSGCAATGIRLYYGTPDVKHPASYLPVYDCVISGNTIADCGTAAILVGDNKNAHYESKKWANAPYFGKAVMDCTIAPYHNRIENNTLAGKAGQADQGKRRARQRNREQYAKRKTLISRADPRLSDLPLFVFVPRAASPAPRPDHSSPWTSFGRTSIPPALPRRPVRSRGGSRWQTSGSPDS